MGWYGVSYYHPAIDANNKVEPGLDAQLEVGVPQHLEAVLLALPLVLLLRVAIEARYEAVQGVEHRCGFAFVAVVVVFLGFFGEIKNRGSGGGGA